MIQELLVKDALIATRNLRMYQPVGCSQFKRDLERAIKLATEALGEDSRTYKEKLRDLRKKNDLK